jgi:carbon storage regulator
MLVLTRRQTESILIDSDIEIVITAIHKNQVKIGVIAPRHIPVYRRELAHRPAPRRAGRGKVLDFYSYDPVPEFIGSFR